jgi:hypothetical protein
MSRILQHLLIVGFLTKKSPARGSSYADAPEGVRAVVTFANAGYSPA